MCDREILGLPKGSPMLGQLSICIHICFSRDTTWLGNVSSTMTKGPGEFCDASDLVGKSADQITFCPAAGYFSTVWLKLGIMVPGHESSVPLLPVSMVSALPSLPVCLTLGTQGIECGCFPD